MRLSMNTERGLSAGLREERPGQGHVRRHICACAGRTYPNRTCWHDVVRICICATHGVLGLKLRLGLRLGLW